MNDPYVIVTTSGPHSPEVVDEEDENNDADTLLAEHQMAYHGNPGVKKQRKSNLKAETLADWEGS